MRATSEYVSAVMFLLCWALAAVITTPARAQSVAAEAETKAGFIIGVADLPLMTGLIEDADASVVFDKPAGRIVESLASGLVSREKIAAFYGETLPELGWTAVDNLAYVREGELLRISVSSASGPVNVRFSLSPE